jgi:hypothetical protein
MISSGIGVLSCSKWSSKWSFHLGSFQKADKYRTAAILKHATDKSLIIMDEYVNARITSR